MRRILQHSMLAIALTAFLASGSLFAQAEKAAKPAKPAKELKTVMKDLSPAMQAQVLEYAKRKLETQKRLATKAVEMSTAATVAKPAPVPMPEQAQAKPAPQPARAIEVAPAAPTAPAAPAKPAYMEMAESMASTQVEWYETTHQFGKVVTGTKVNHTFKFKNVGTEPLKLTRVKASCGCTTPKWSSEEVAPGEEGFIDVSFNTSGKSGAQTKTVTVTGNFQPINMVLRIRGEVEKVATEQK